MLPLKRLLLIIGTIIAMALGFLIFIISTNSPVSSGYVNSFNAELTLEEAIIPEGLFPEVYYIVGDRDKASDKIIIDNVIQTLSYMKLNYIEKKEIIIDDLESKPVLIFCSDQPNLYMELFLIGDYISNGGKMLFAAGLPDNNDISYLYPILGIIEKGTKVETNELHFRKNVIPYDEVTTEYIGYNASTNIYLNEQANVLIETQEGPPLLYSHQYQKGNVTVINGTLLDNKSSEGILCTALGDLMGELIYPIIGTKTVFLDEYPPIQYMDQDLSMKYYGRAVSSFLRDVLWPKLLQSATLYDITYTAGILGDFQSEEDTLLYNESLVKYLLKEVMRYSGEVIIMGDLSSTEELEEEQISNYYSEFHDIFPEYQINGYAFLFGVADPNEMMYIDKIFEHLYSLRGVYQGDFTTQMVQNFGFEEGYVQFPVISSGFGTNNEGYYEFISGLTLQGVVSHSFNVRSLFTTEDKSWDHVEESYQKINKDFFGKTNWLKAATMSESAKNTMAYDKLSITVEYDEEKTQVYCIDFRKGQAFYLRTSKEVKEIIGGSVQKINEMYYLIEATSPEFTVLYE